MGVVEKRGEGIGRLGETSRARRRWRGRRRWWPRHSGDDSRRSTRLSERQPSEVVITPRSRTLPQAPARRVFQDESIVVLWYAPRALRRPDRRERERADRRDLRAREIVEHVERLRTSPELRIRLAPGRVCRTPPPATPGS